MVPAAAQLRPWNSARVHGRILRQNERRRAWRVLCRRGWRSGQDNGDGHRGGNHERGETAMPCNIGRRYTTMCLGHDFGKPMVRPGISRRPCGTGRRPVDHVHPYPCARACSCDFSWQRCVANASVRATPSPSERCAASHATEVSVQTHPSADHPLTSGQALPPGRLNATAPGIVPTGL